MAPSIAEAFAEIDELIENGSFHNLTKAQLDALSLAKRVLSSFELLAIASSEKEDY